MAYLKNELLQRGISGIIFATLVLGSLLIGPFTFFFLASIAFLYISFIEWPLIAPKNRVFASILFGIWICLPFLILSGLTFGGTMYGLFLLFITVWLHDTAAYIIGKKWGSLRLAPSISPQKTIEGLTAGFIATFVFTYATNTDILRLVPQFSLISKENLPYNALIIAFLITITATAGDLFESWLKRRANIKDTGNVLPGHGGLLDRLDSILFLLLLIGILQKTFAYWTN